MCSQKSIFLKLRSGFTAELIGFQMLDPAVSTSPNNNNPYVGPTFNISFDEIQRGNFTPYYLDISRYEPPPLELYTRFSLFTYFVAFWIIHFCQIFVICFFDKLWFKRGSSSVSLCRTLFNSIIKSHFPFPDNDWDVENGGCLDHIKRQRKNQTEFLILTAVNSIFNMALLTPLLMLCNV